jgi:tubulin polyglutamylase TTLL6/13
MKPYQKINHFPGMVAISRKNQLARNLARMKKVFGKEYNFFPKTWLLPSEFTDFRKKYGNSRKSVFIVKPEAS